MKQRIKAPYKYYKMFKKEWKQSQIWAEILAK